MVNVSNHDQQQQQDAKNYACCTFNVVVDFAVVTTSAFIISTNNLFTFYLFTCVFYALNFSDAPKNKKTIEEEKNSDRIEKNMLNSNEN